MKRIWVIAVSVLAYLLLLEGFYDKSLGAIRALSPAHQIGGNADPFDRLLVLHFFPAAEELFSIPGGKAYFVLRSRLSSFDTGIRLRYFQLTSAHYLSVVGVGQAQLSADLSAEPAPR